MFPGFHARIIVPLQFIRSRLDWLGSSVQRISDIGDDRDVLTFEEYIDDVTVHTMKLIFGQKRPKVPPAFMLALWLTHKIG